MNHTSQSLEDEMDQIHSETEADFDARRRRPETEPTVCRRTPTATQNAPKEPND